MRMMIINLGEPSPLAQAVATTIADMKRTGMLDAIATTIERMERSGMSNTLRDIVQSAPIISLPAMPSTLAPLIAPSRCSCEH